GMRLGSIHRQGMTPSARPLQLLRPLLAKLLLYPLLLLLLASLLQFNPLMVRAVVLQGAAPTAISLLLIAESVGADQERAAGLVFWSTLLALISAPAWGVLLRSQF
ncbi:MAG: AEC family transporter, partial [Synechococcus sp.]